MTAITLSQVTRINDAIAQGRTPWITVADGAVVGIYYNRDQARAAKNGKPVKYVEGDGFELVDVEQPASDTHDYTGQPEPTDCDDGENCGEPTEPVSLGGSDELIDSLAEFQSEFGADKDALPAEMAPAVIPAVEEDKPKAADKAKLEVRHASEVVRPTKLVWAIADKMKAANPAVTRKEILEECERVGIAFYTARTQYQVWKSMQA